MLLLDYLDFLNFVIAFDYSEIEIVNHAIALVVFVLQNYLVHFDFVVTDLVVHFVVEVDFLDFLGDWLADDVELLFFYIVDNGFVNAAVEHVALYLLAETLAELWKADMALAEAGDVMGVADFAELGIDFRCIVSFFNLGNYLAVYVVDFFECNIHYQ